MNPDEIMDSISPHLAEIQDDPIVKVLLHVVRQCLPICIEQGMNEQQIRRFFEEVFENKVVRTWAIIQVIVLTEFEARA